MFTYILIAIIIGFLSGIGTGLTPGVHINLVATIVLLIGPALNIHPLLFIFFLIALGITHTFFDSIPSILLGIPDDSTLIAALPGHKLAAQGYGYEAIKMTVIGSYCALLCALLLIPILLIFIPFISEVSAKYIIPILFFFLCIQTIKEKTWSIRMWSIIITILSGVLGFFTLRSYQLSHPFFHLFSGLFGISTLLHSIMSTSVIAKQHITDHDYEIKDIVSPVSSSLFAGVLTGIIPGIGNAHASLIAFVFTKFRNITYLIMQGGINTTSMIVALVTLATINKSRNGLVTVLHSFIAMDSSTLWMIAAAVILIGNIAIGSVLWVSKKYILVVEKIPYQILSLLLIIFLLIISLLLDNVYGIITILVSSCIGMLPLLTGTKRSISIACLLVPLLLYYSGY